MTGSRGDATGLGDSGTVSITCGRGEMGKNDERLNLIGIRLIVTRKDRGKRIGLFQLGKGGTARFKGVGVKEKDCTTGCKSKWSEFTPPRHLH